jgi:hypothetical protein
LASENFEIMPGDNLAAVGITDLFEQLLFASSLAAFFAACLIASRIDEGKCIISTWPLVQRRSIEEGRS